MKENWRPYVIALVVTLGGGVLVGWLTREGTQSYATMQQPPLAPPGWLFPVAWTILYTLMAVGIALVYNRSTGIPRQRALRIYAAQLLVNLLWPVFFFIAQAYLFSFLWLLLLLALVLWMTVVFYSVSPPAALLQLPYILWLCFAGYLNFAVFLLNK